MGKRAARRNKQLQLERQAREDERAFEHVIELERAEAGTGQRNIELSPTKSVGVDNVPLPGGVPARTDTPEVLRAVGEAVERAVGEGSNQPRFRQDVNAASVFQSTYRFVKIALLSSMPNENASVREWDKWYRDIFKAEPFLLGVFNSVVQIDKNRGWTLTGGRNQVARFTNVLKDADDGAGWRAYADWQAQSYYFAQAGCVTETGRDVDGGPLRALWSVDPTRIELTGSRETPLRYFPATGKPQDWEPQDFFRAASLVSTDETKRGYGYPAIARCLELARIMVGVYELYGEATLTREPQGVITGKNISHEMWTTALQSYDELLLGKNKIFGKLMTLMSDGPDAPEFAINLFRRLPEGFDLNAWTNLLMYGYALEFGYDPREFFPVSGGQLGTAKETEAQHRKATSKGDRDFSLAHQDQLQNQLPETLLFQYEQRDVEGETADALAATAKAQLITEMNKWTVNGSNVLTPDQILQLAAQHGIIPEDWTPQEESVTVSDTDPEGLERARANERIRRAAFEFPQEPIVRYEFPAMKMRMLFRSGDELLARRVYPAPVVEARAGVPAQSPFNNRTVARSVKSVADEFCTYWNLYLDTYFTRARAGQNVANDLKELLSTWIASVYFEGLREAGVDPQEFADEDYQKVDDLTFEQFQFVPEFAQAVVEAKADKSLREAVKARAGVWCNTLARIGENARNGAAGGLFEFVLSGNPSDESCSTCQKLLGKRHRWTWVVKNGYEVKPGNENFECGCYRCPHAWEPV